ncbi:LAME_0G04852g1_1 [Lachancea meyersii CBS 8951]|uniref:LAME_0G04852g1_1 n=1 Tax=Lachancea meyersii CBS 8951 TaxID=1266667 RepID=A0A1G4K710_9SACH|nr:LAME_0G04852g1_1 [Lachancea meyersii CBS 8951]
MRRSFTTVVALLAKRSKQDSQNTLKFLAHANRSTTISSLFEKPGTDAVHVQKVVDLLNNELPDGESNRRRVDAHYDILMSRLKQVVEKSIAQTGVDDVTLKSQQLSAQEMIKKCTTSDQLYALLLELQVSGKLTTSALAKIIMNRQFTHLSQVQENLPGFSHELELAAMLVYRGRGHEASLLYKNYTERWTSRWHKLAPMAQKLIWKCDHRILGVPGVVDRSVEISGWTASDWVGLYQALYSAAYQLPRPHSTQLTKVQHLFVESLRALSMCISNSGEAKKRSLEAVRASVENRLSYDTPEETGATVYQYRFLRRLDDLLQLSARDADVPEEARLVLAKVLDSLHREEEVARSQMVIKFI